MEKYFTISKRTTNSKKKMNRYLLVEHLKQIYASAQMCQNNDKAVKLENTPKQKTKTLLNEDVDGDNGDNVDCKREDDYNKKIDNKDESHLIFAITSNLTGY